MKHSPRLAKFGMFLDRHRILPNGFAEGFLFSQSHWDDRHAFLLGHYSTSGWWYYFPVAFVSKTPVSILVLTVIGLGWLLKKSRQLVMNAIFIIGADLHPLAGENRE
jgi:hypothetical protein